MKLWGRHTFSFQKQISNFFVYSAIFKGWWYLAVVGPLWQICWNCTRRCTCKYWYIVKWIISHSAMTYISQKKAQIEILYFFQYSFECIIPATGGINCTATVTQDNSPGSTATSNKWISCNNTGIWISTWATKLHRCRYTYSPVSTTQIFITGELISIHLNNYLIKINRCMYMKM